ncbi:MAG TPA: hypothetical protein VF234_09935, partial [Limnochordia bacterium]
MLLAGAAAVDVTPPIGVDLQGYVSRAHGAEGILDPLMFRCVVCESGTERWALLAADLISFENEDADRIRTAAAQALGKERAAVSLVGTHTHSGPALLRLRGFGEVPPGYVDQLAAAAGRAVSMALERLQAVTAVTVSGSAAFAVNRRRPQPDGSIALAPYPHGPVDPTVTVTLLRPAAEGRGEAGPPVAILANYACHPVTLGVNYHISADFPGVYARAVEAVFPGTVAFYLNGASGDINPIGMGDPAYTRRCGLELAGEVIRLVGRGAAAASEPAVLAVSEDVVTLPLDELPPRSLLEEELRRCEARIAAAGSPSDGSVRGSIAVREWAQGCLAEWDGHGAVPHRTEACMQAVRLGHAAFAFVPGELFVELGLHIRRQSPARHTHVVGYANGWVGYLP